METRNEFERIKSNEKNKGKRVGQRWIAFRSQSIRLDTSRPRLFVPKSTSLYFISFHFPFSFWGFFFLFRVPFAYTADVSYPMSWPLHILIFWNAFPRKTPESTTITYHCVSIKMSSAPWIWSQLFVPFLSWSFHADADKHREIGSPPSSIVFPLLTLYNAIIFYCFYFFLIIYYFLFYVPSNLRK